MGLNEDGVIFREGGGGGGPLESISIMKVCKKKGGLRPIRKGVLERGLFERLQWKFRLQVD